MRRSEERVTVVLVDVDRSEWRNRAVCSRGDVIWRCDITVPRGGTSSSGAGSARQTGVLYRRLLRRAVGLDGGEEHSEKRRLVAVVHHVRAESVLQAQAVGVHEVAADREPLRFVATGYGHAGEPALIVTARAVVSASPGRRRR
jgi:hypothetical protein